MNRRKDQANTSSQASKPTKHIIFDHALSNNAATSGPQTRHPRSPKLLSLTPIYLIALFQTSKRIHSRPPKMRHPQIQPTQKRIILRTHKHIIPCTPNASSSGLTWGSYKHVSSSDLIRGSESERDSRSHGNDEQRGEIPRFQWNNDRGVLSTGFQNYRPWH